MKIPTSYGEWCNLFDEMAQGARDESYLDLIQRGQISFTSGVAERFVQAVSHLITTRVNAAQDMYQRQMRNARGVPSSISSALMVLKKEYVYDYRITQALPIPEEYRKQLGKLIQDQADLTQKSLEDSAKADRTGHLTSIVRNAGVNKLVSCQKG